MIQPRPTAIITNICLTIQFVKVNLNKEVNEWYLVSNSLQNRYFSWIKCYKFHNFSSVSLINS